MKLSLRVIPNARRTEFLGRREGEIVLRLNAPAIEGKANKAAIEFIAKQLGGHIACGLSCLCRDV